MKNIVYLIKLSSLGILHAYSQIFFSKSYALAVLLMCISFFDMYGGLCGLLAVALTQITAVAFHANAKSISDGTFSFNALLTGIGIGVMYEFNISVIILVFLASLLSFLITQYSISYFGGKNLPFLGVPFILVMWIIMSSASNFSALSLMHKTNFFYSDYLTLISTPITEYIGGLALGNFLHLYFRSLGAIFFQYNDLAGILICLGILFYSRIQWLLSVFGFTIGYIFYIFFEGDFSQLVYSYIGFNFILTAIALGGFFLVPTRRVFLLLVFLTPIIGLLISACHTILFVKLGLPVYALPFNVTVILALATLQAREKATGLFVTTWHEFSPEKVLYTYLFNKKVVKEPHFIPISLPIQGEWYISQAFDGAITHKGEWRFAWDFIKLDENDKPSKPNPKKAEDFYCFDEPAYAPADGYVVNMLDGIADNVLGKIEAEKNWGNVLVIKHAEHLYSSIAHFKAGSFKVNVGDYVKCGQLLGLCGNSGYSYEPHLHFQLQATPNIGAPTIEYPLFMYLTKENKKITSHHFKFPKHKEKVLGFAPNTVLKDAFKVSYGQVFEWKLKWKNGKTEDIKWHILADIHGFYIYCENTKAVAYFYQDEVYFHFTNFYGKKDSFLFDFYTHVNKFLIRHAPHATYSKVIPNRDISPKILMWFNDFFVPFFEIFSANFTYMQRNEAKDETFLVETEINVKVFAKEIVKQKAEFIINAEGFEYFKMTSNNQLKYTAFRRKD